MSLDFAAEERLKLFTVPITNNGDKNANRTFTVGLGKPTGDVSLGSPRVASIAIIDNDPGVQFQQNRLWVRQSEESVMLTVTRGNDIHLDSFTVDYTTTNGTAKAGVDCVAAAGTLRIGGTGVSSHECEFVSTGQPSRMARKYRIQYEGAAYHIMNRGDRREPIFRDDQDRTVFRETLGASCGQTGWEVHAVCLMPNHFHPVLETPQPNWVEGDSDCGGSAAQGGEERGAVGRHKNGA